MQALHARLRWTTMARWGLAHWAFGNLYESLVDLPGRLAALEPADRPTVYGRGSPVRYYVPAVPLTLAATFVAVERGDHVGVERRASIVALSGTVLAVGITGYLVRTVNLPLLRGGAASSGAVSPALLRRWHVANGVRLVALLTVWTALGATPKPMTRSDVASTSGGGVKG